MNYIRRHWQGELPLAVSFWVNVLLVNFVVVLVQTALFSNLIDVYPPIVARLFFGFTVVVTALVYPWQIIGLWRSCSRHIYETKKSAWARAAQVLVVLGLLATVANVNRDWPIYKDFYRAGFQKDPLGDYALKVEGNDRFVHLTGWLTFGVSDDLADLLRENPGVVHLARPGLRSNRRLRKHISEWCRSSVRSRLRRVVM